jgi:anthranilate synthase/aminodeoxychorismate synthase-like glutamine amidotransferase
VILLIDNYDSFTFNLRRYLVRLGQEVRVLRNDAPELRRELTGKYAALVISPGPKGPSEAGSCLEVVAEYSGRLPILGVCLGHQIIFQAFGGEIGRAQCPMHGKTSEIELLPSRLFAGLGSPTSFARYHSLIGIPESLPAWLKVTAWSREGEIMAAEHQEHLTFGVQFHPESVLSTGGYQVLQNFLTCAGLHRVDELPAADWRETPHILNQSIAQHEKQAEHECQPVALPHYHLPS